MLSSSFTSSFEPTPEERLRAAAVPWACIAFVMSVGFVEMMVYDHREWVADLAAWQWEVKSQLLERGELDSDVVVFGSSILFHGLDPLPANREMKNGMKAVNLALNGQT